MREALESSTADFGEDDPNSLNRLINLAGVYRSQDRMNEAERMLKQALAGFQKLDANEGSGKASTDTITTMNNLAELLQAVGRADEALPLLESAYSLAKVLQVESERACPPKADDAKRAKAGSPNGSQKGESNDNLDSLYLTILNNLASHHQASGQLELAEPLLQEALKMRKETQGHRHPKTLIVVNNLANVLKMLGGKRNQDQAVNYYRESLAAKRETLGEHHESTLKAMNNLAVFLVEQQKLGEAEPIMEQAFNGYKVQMGTTHPDTIFLVRNYSQVLWNLGKRDQALQMVNETLTIVSEKRGTTDASTRGLAQTYAQLLRAARENEKAQKVEEQYMAS